VAADTCEPGSFFEPISQGETRAFGRVTRRGFLGVAGATLLSLTSPLAEPASALGCGSTSSPELTVLPEDGRGIYLRTIDAAKESIRIEICVLEDPQILDRVEAALHRGVSVRAIVDFRKYSELAAERKHLEEYLTSAGGELHLSNPVFPRSFPKIMLIDSDVMVYGSACLDQTTFLRYRDFATTCTDEQVLRDAQRLFENDWTYSASLGEEPAAFNPTSPISSRDVMIAPVNAGQQLVGLYQQATQALDVYTELLGNPTLESELVAAAERGVLVRLIAPARVSGGTKEVQERQLASLTALSASGVNVHVNGGETVGMPYMHARAAVVDEQKAYLGSLSLSPDSITYNREFGMIFRDEGPVRQLQQQFASDYELRTRKF
jgi:phosphatidylserine/phosphatidylglycerophosphate/cardiolipin synthase-like enzyme